MQRKLQHNVSAIFNAFPMAIANSPDWPLTQNASWGFWDKPSKRGILLR
ncbi:hypothetical protein KBT16_31490 [Nostoc sp. CCCryo 231-06]|nr:hypothetical protein [Nostoc sp. CCCryo 231-06]